MCLLPIAIEVDSAILRYNKRFSFNIPKFYLEHFTTVDAKFWNILSIGFLQVASNCCFRNNIKELLFRFHVIFLYISKMKRR